MSFRVPKKASLKKDLKKTIAWAWSCREKDSEEDSRALARWQWQLPQTMERLAVAALQRYRRLKFIGSAGLAMSYGWTETLELWKYTMRIAMLVTVEQEGLFRQKRASKKLFPTVRVRKFAIGSKLCNFETVFGIGRGKIEKKSVNKTCLLPFTR